MTFIQGNEISNARDTTHERPTHEEAECLDDIEVATHTRRNRNKTSIDDTTTQYKRHLDDCVKDHVSLKGQGNLFLPLQAPRSDSASGIQTRKYDQAKIRELPFAFTEYELFTLLMKTASPHYVRISHATAKADCWTSYEVEKKRISITTDMWKSGQKIQYIVLTAHFVDSDWNLQKRVLNFVDMPPLHSGVFAYDVLYKFLQDWDIEGKVCSIFMENASYNDATIRMLKYSLSFHKMLYLNENLFHVSCCAHILNLLVHDGLFEIEDVIDNEVRSFLTLFNEVTNIISSFEYPTSNLFLLELWSIKEKFDKYWGECNLLISITAILDPRNKMKLINFSFYVIYFKEKAPRKICIVRGSLYEIYKEYVNEYATTNVGKSYDWKVQVCESVDTIDNVKPKLDIYLEEGVLICKENCGDFDALECWKVNKLKF
ncbi:hypothetical protein ES288_A13G142500v1 [Gossypium darwinii]|uniref:hAT-like transposase RNase-H fold domain-containing protein n=1 Tax=Gossypium darwinii TaxID=34276 RepID=A0A5D2DZM6_GOSDA|nr:hypothetical protein ES288_A13G142500v1 [Gossypium darwinii]